VDREIWALSGSIHCEQAQGDEPHTVQVTVHVAKELAALTLVLAARIGPSAHHLNARRVVDLCDGRSRLLNFLNRSGQIHFLP
jgi:hypothetical protein